MQRNEFERAIKLGLGRIILYLEKHDAKPFRDIILYCCLHNISHDTQVEGYKTEYIAEIIALTGETEFYREKVMDAAYTIDLQTEDFTKDEYHIFSLVHQFALRGDAGARQFIYDSFLEHLSRKDTPFAWKIVELDKLDGFLYVMEHANYDDYENDDLLWTLEDDIGEKEARLLLKPHRLKNPKLDRVLKSIFGKRNQIKKRHAQAKQQSPHLSYQSLKLVIQSERSDRILRTWAKTATPQELEEAAHDLLKTTNDEHLIRYLQIFWYTPFPFDPEKLYHLLEHEHPQISGGATIILEQLKHDSVRDFSLRLIKEGKYESRAVSMLTINAQEGDWGILEDVVKRDYDIDEFHWIQHAIGRKFFRENPSKKALNTLLYLYENAPCSNCRYDIVEHLHEIDGLTESIREECFHDSKDAIRKWAKEIFQ